MVSSIQNQAMDLLKTRKAEIMKKLQTQDVEEAIVTGGNAFTETVWEKMLEGLDDYLDEVKKEQEIRFAKQDEKAEEKALLEKRRVQKEAQEALCVKELLIARSGGSLNVPYGYLAKNGVIEYDGIVFVCDELRNAICLGDVTREKDVIRIPLEEGGCLKVNRDNLDDLAKAISMFSPEDIRRIMEAIATDAKCQQMQQEMDETIHGVTGTTTIATSESEADEVTAEQIAKLFQEIFE